jgi:WD40 repeat protein
VNDDLEMRQAADPDPGQVTTQQDFGREITAARVRAGLTIRQVARAAGLPISTVGDYFSGRHLPAHTQPEPVLRILRACGETDPVRLAEWTSALRRARRPPGRRRSAESPYRGLARFEPDDAQWFFGREDITDRLAGLAASAEAGTAGSETGDPLILVGPSGSGKSSLLRAGLIPRLPGRYVIFEPGPTPVPALAAELAGLEQSEDCGKPAIVVDQFEAVFTECQDEAQRREFITEISRLAANRLVVLALRADFYEQALRYPELSRALQTRQVVLRPMTADQVRRAITEPARVARLDVVGGLADLLLRDLAPAAPAGGASSEGEPGAHEPGALPLVSHAMLATWEHSRGGQITIADYVATGGIRDALTRTAESAYGELSGDDQRRAQRLLLHLVHVADDAPPTRARVQMSELRNWAGADPEHVLGRFVGARLITVDADTAQITHDALLTAWPRLRSWVDAGRDDLRARRRIAEAARTWQDTGREAAALWRGSQLAIARDWAADEDKRASLSPLGREFVDAAVDADQASQRSGRRQTRRLQRLVAALTALVIAVFGLAGYAFQQREAAATARDQASSREIALEAGQLRSQNAPLAAQLSAAAYDISHTPQATASLLESTGSPSATRLLDSAGVVESVSVSPDRKLLAVAAADGTLRLWDIASQGHPVPIGPPLISDSNAPLYTASFSPDGQVLAAAGAGRSVVLWNVRDPAHPVLLGQPLTGPANTIYSVAFSPDGGTLAAGSADRSVWLWDVSDPAHPVPLGKPLTGAGGYMESVAFAPGGTILAAGSADKTVRLWNVANPAHPVPFGGALTGPGSLVTSVAFSSNGQMLAAGSQDDKVWLWRIGADGVVPDGTLTGATEWVNAVAFSPDGTDIAAATSDASVLIWNVASGALVATLPHPQPVTSLAWDGTQRLAAGDASGAVSVWTVPPPVLQTGSPAYDAVFSPDGKTLAVSTRDSLQLWSTATRDQLAAQQVPGTFVNAVQYAPSGNILATGYGDGMLQFWRAAGTLVPLGQPVQASGTGMTETVAFSPDGQIAATGGDDGTVRLWSVRDPARPQLLATINDSATYVFGVAFSPNGRTIAAASADNVTRLWNVADPRRPALLGRPLLGPSSYAISVAFSPDGSLLAVGSADKAVRLWDVADPRRPVSVGAPITGPTSYVYGVAFSPDGKILAAAITDGTVWLWNVAVPQQPGLLATLAGPNGNVYSVAFAPQGDRLAAASADGTVRLWDVNPAAAEAAVCAGAGQAITRPEWATYVPGVPYRSPCG